MYLEEGHESDPCHDDLSEEEKDENSFIKDDQFELKKVINKETIQNLNRFHRKQKKGTIDVWWLFDDGGLAFICF